MPFVLVDQRIVRMVTLVEIYIRPKRIFRTNKDLLVVVNGRRGVKLATTILSEGVKGCNHSGMNPYCKIMFDSSIQTDFYHSWTPVANV